MNECMCENDCMCDVNEYKICKLNKKLKRLIAQQPTMAGGCLVRLSARLSGLLPAHRKGVANHDRCFYAIHFGIGDCIAAY